MNDNRSFHLREGIPCAWRALGMSRQANDVKEALDGKQPISYNQFFGFVL